MTTNKRLRDMELRIAEDMTSVLDYVSRVQQAIDSGDWHYLVDKASALARAAQRLADAAGYEIDHRQTRPGEAARPAVIVAAIRRYARYYVAGRALYPARAAQRRARAHLDVAAVEEMNRRIAAVLNTMPGAGRGEE